jgi:hypothetical protein
MVRRRTARRIGADEKQSAKMYSASVENGLRAHDDDPHVPVLIIAAVVKDLVTPQVFRHVV